MWFDLWSFHYSGQKTTQFSRKKEAFIGLLEAYTELAKGHTHDKAKNFAYWQIRCELVSSKKTRETIQNY